MLDSLRLFVAATVAVVVVVAAPSIAVHVALVIPEVCSGQADDLRVRLEETGRQAIQVAGLELPIKIHLDFLTKEEVCDSRPEGLEATLSAISAPQVDVVVASIPAEGCEAAGALARTKGKPFLTWSCGGKSVGGSGWVQMAPRVSDISDALLGLFAHFKWASGVIVAQDSTWGRDVCWQLELALRRQEKWLEATVWVQAGNDASDVEENIQKLTNSMASVVVLCLPLSSPNLHPLLAAVKKRQQSQAADKSKPLMVAINLDTRLSSWPPEALLNAHVSMLLLAPSEATDILNKSFKPQSVEERVFDCVSLLSRSIEATMESSDNHTTLLNLLTSGTISFRDSRGRQSHLASGAKRTHTVLWRWNPATSRMDKELVLAARAEPEDPLPSPVPPMVPGDSLCQPRHDCEATNGESQGNMAYLVAILLGAGVLASVSFFGVAWVRRQLSWRHVPKAQNKILLKVADLAWAVPSESKRVSGERLFSPCEAFSLSTGLEVSLHEFLELSEEAEKPDLLKASMASLRNGAAAGKGAAGGSTPSLRGPIWTADLKVRFNSDPVQLKALPVQGSIDLNNKALTVLETLHSLRHENVAAFLGCLIEGPQPALVLELCARGSLEDILAEEDIRLDWAFRLSLLTDLVRGMRYLHSSPVRVHGNLTSRNCVIDSRWVLKITDFGLPSFHSAQGLHLPTKSPRDLLWTAPELLRDEELARRGTQPGDVYSFAIIMQEVLVRGPPFGMLSLTPEEILEKVKRPPPLIRPSVSKGAAPPEAINIMRQCWAELADMRPDFHAIHDLFKTLNHGRKTNIVDTMFRMLEKYSTNLEELIRERTEQLDLEKKKTEQLLNRMLPSMVAEKLKLGLPVDPEDFSEVTIYFSDIVGFTTISAHSTPFEVVDLLNDLYTCFDATINAYEVYKVETIGDAYMVVGGVPVRTPDHAQQIATMALDLLHEAGKFRISHLPYCPLWLRIGIHTGPCCAGVVGLTMPRYCLFGDTVNTAARMESTGSAWRIHVSPATKAKLEATGEFRLEYRGETEIRGKGRLPTYWLLGREGFHKELPTPPELGENNHGLDESLVKLGRTGPPPYNIQPATSHPASDSTPLPSSSPSPPTQKEPAPTHAVLSATPSLDRSAALTSWPSGDLATASTSTHTSSNPAPSTAPSTAPSSTPSSTPTPTPATPTALPLGRRALSPAEQLAHQLLNGRAAYGAAGRGLRKQMSLDWQEQRRTVKQWSLEPGLIRSGWSGQDRSRGSPLLQRSRTGDADSGTGFSRFQSSRSVSRESESLIGEVDVEESPEDCKEGVVEARVEPIRESDAMEDPHLLLD